MYEFKRKIQEIGETREQCNEIYGAWVLISRVKMGRKSTQIVII